MNSLVRTSEQPVIDITNIEETCGIIKSMLESVGLPNERIFAPTKERFRVFSNFDAVLEAIPADKIGESFYISKFIAAVFAGLFDAVQVRIANIVKEINRDEEPLHKQAYLSVEDDKIVIE